MNSILHFFIVTNLVLILGTGLYFLLLKSTTFFRANRIYLLLLIVFSVVSSFLPSVPEIFTFMSAKTNLTPFFDSSTSGFQLLDFYQISDTLGPQKQTSFGLPIVFLVIQITGTLFLFIKFVYRLGIIHGIKKGSEKLNLQEEALSPIRGKLSPYVENYFIERTSVFNTHERIAPFSFFRTIILNFKPYSETQLTSILIHEFIHIRKRHFLDIMFSEIFKVLFWYNPASWLITRFIKQNIENQTDQLVMDSGVNRKDYQYNLLQVSQHYKTPSLTINFNYHNLKNRIQMMNQKRTTKVNGLRYAVAIALLVPAFIFQSPDSFAQKQKDASVQAPNQNSLKVNLTGEVLSKNDPRMLKSYKWRRQAQKICSQFDILPFLDFSDLPKDTVTVVDPQTYEEKMVVAEYNIPDFPPNSVGFKLNGKKVNVKALRKLQAGEVRGYGLATEEKEIRKEGFHNKQAVFMVTTK